MSSRTIKFPIIDDDLTGFFLKTDKTNKESITSSLLLLLLTEQHERFYLPDYGVNLWRFIFEPGDGITEEKINTYINRKVNEYIPNITISEIQYDVDEHDENRINILIRFTYNEDSFKEEHEIIISNKI